MKCEYLGCEKEAIKRAGIYGCWYCEQHAMIASAHAEEHVRKQLNSHVE